MLSSYEGGERKITSHLPPYVYYYVDRHGSHTSIYHDKVKQARFTDRKKFQRALDQHRRQGIPIFESDVNPVYRLLEERFPDNDTPPLKISIIDIECDKDPAKGWSNVSSPYAIINAITIYNKWEKDEPHGGYYTLCVAPPNMTRDEAIALLDSENEDDSFGSMNEANGYLVCHTEADLIAMTLEIIGPADVITGWNSTFFDLPYLIQRTRIVWGGEKLRNIEKENGTDERPFKPSGKSTPWLKKFCLEEFDCLPEMRMVAKFGTAEKTFDIFGRVHMDYLELYRKFTFEELHSYTLDFILEREVNQRKVQYEGSLDQLYRNDFRTFIAYNRQDVAGLAAMDEKLKMVELASTMAHMASVPFNKVFGSVAIIEQAILKELHKQGMVCFDKNIDDAEHVKVPGAFVVTPHKGLYDWVASFDINSLYPSVIRALNISPECVLGQFRPDKTDQKIESLMLAGMDFTEAWGQLTGALEYHDIAEESGDVVTFQIEPEERGAEPEEVAATGKEWKATLRENKWALSANGTVFDLSREGIVPFCLTKWYAQRQEWQGEKKARKAAQADAEGEELARLKAEESYYDMIQLVMKIFLNSTYGALLNAFCRFYDPRLGKSVTLTGRLITKHMIRKASECATGEYDFDRRAIIYGDTDSAYCTLDWYMGHHDIDKTVENAVAIADAMGEEINDSFPAFMDSECLCGLERGAIIQAGREVVGRRGLFKDAKKRYAIHVVDNEGFSADKLKIMGMEVRRSDTPRFIQEFLSGVIEDVVKHNKSHEEVYEKVQEFRDTFRAMDPWQRGTPCRVSNLKTSSRLLTNYEMAVADGHFVKKPHVHWTVVAANNTNALMQQHDEHRWDFIRDGDKCEVLYLLPNPTGLKSVAIKVGENYVPDWFKELPFDDTRHEQKLIDKKLENVVGSILDWSFAPVQDNQDSVFEEVDFFAD